MGFGCAGTGMVETGDDACSSGDDEDGDGLIDCEDPDCLSAEVCRNYAAIGAPIHGDEDAVDGGVLNPWMDPGLTGSPESQPPLDAGAAGGGDDVQGGDGDADDAPSPLDAGASSDAGAPVEDDDVPLPTCDPACSDGQFCMDGTCVEVGASTDGMFELQVLSATVPDKNAIENCFDTVCPGVVSSPFGLCLCDPDTYVKVLRVSEGISSLVGVTATAERSLSPQFGDVFDVELLEGDVLIFEVWDEDDEPLEDSIISACSPDLTSFSAGPISCSSLAGSIGRPVESVVSATLEQKK